MGIRYEQDFYGWTQEQAALLRAGRLDEIDLEHLIEEVESVGNSERGELESRLELLLQHLLKWRFQPNRRGQSWRLTIQEQRRRLARRLKHSPSLKNGLDESQEESYEVARLAAARETALDIDTFPDQCPWTFEQLMDPEFLPD